MALRVISSRHIEWYCKNCQERSKENAIIKTTEAAERHADETGHQVMAFGAITYFISQGSVEVEDPFAPRATA